jgi:hypothetical protein
MELEPDWSLLQNERILKRIVFFNEVFPQALWITGLLARYN